MKTVTLPAIIEILDKESFVYKITGDIVEVSLPKGATVIIHAEQGNLAYKVKFGIVPMKAAIIFSVGLFSLTLGAVILLNDTMPPYTIYMAIAVFLLNADYEYSRYKNVQKLLKFYQSNEML